jgi:hypothetical protein
MTSIEFFFGSGRPESVGFGCFYFSAKKLCFNSFFGVCPLQDKMTKDSNKKNIERISFVFIFKFIQQLNFKDLNDLNRHLQVKDFIRLMC